MFYELVQNADDAGATEVSFMLDCRDYGTSSLLGPKMADWQGPALLCHNNAVFTKEDFNNLSRIGQGSKLDKISATGVGLHHSCSSQCTYPRLFCCLTEVRSWVQR